MPKFRTLEAVTYVHEGKVVSAEANREVEMSDEQAEKLAGKVARAVVPVSMFPSGNPVFNGVTISGAPAVTYEVVKAPEVEEVAKPEVKAVAKPEVKAVAKPEVNPSK